MNVISEAGGILESFSHFFLIVGFERWDERFEVGISIQFTFVFVIW
jgi:hypothetical protein